MPDLLQVNAGGDDVVRRSRGNRARAHSPDDGLVHIPTNNVTAAERNLPSRGPPSCLLRLQIHLILRPFPTHLRRRQQNHLLRRQIQIHPLLRFRLHLRS